MFNIPVELKEIVIVFSAVAFNENCAPFMSVSVESAFNPLATSLVLRLSASPPPPTAHSSAELPFALMLVDLKTSYLSS